MGIDANLTGVPDFDQLEVVKQGIAVIPSYTIAGAGTTRSSIVVTHGLGYIPAVLAYATLAGGSSNYWVWAGSNFDSFSISGGNIDLQLVHNYNTLINTSTIEFEIESINGSASSTGGESYSLVYYLLRSKAKNS